MQKVISYLSVKDSVIELYKDSTHSIISFNMSNGIINSVNVNLVTKIDSSQYLLNKHHFIKANGKKIICGYTCYNAEDTLYKKDHKYYVYFTKEIMAPVLDFCRYRFDGIDGYPMEFNCVDDDIQTIYKITNISSVRVDDSEFEIPEGYHRVNYIDGKKQYWK
jgi:hypothetical protein